MALYRTLLATLMLVSVDPALINFLLDRNPVNFSVWLSQPGPDATVTALESAGVLRDTGTFIGAYGYCGRAELHRFLLTRRGREIAAAQGWTLHPAFLEIPAGRLQYVAGSQTVHVRAPKPFVAFLARFEANSSAQYLLRLGPASAWRAEVLPGQDFSLAQAREAVHFTLPLLRSGNAWVPSPGWNWDPVPTVSCER